MFNLNSEMVTSAFNAFLDAVLLWLYVLVADALILKFASLTSSFVQEVPNNINEVKLNRNNFFCSIFIGVYYLKN